MTRETHTKEKKQTLKGYKREKLRILKQLGFNVEASVFDEATTEVQIDNIAHSIIMAQERRQLMELSQIARILYNMSLDMDYMDYEETKNIDIDSLTRELETVKENCPYLMQVLEIIATRNA